MPISFSRSTQLYWFDWVNASHTLLTDGKSKNAGAVWASDGTMIAFYSTQRNGKDRDVVAMSFDPATRVFGPVIVLCEAAGFLHPIGFSPDNSALLIKQYVSVNESYVYRMVNVRDRLASSSATISDLEKLPFMVISSISIAVCDIQHSHTPGDRASHRSVFHWDQSALLKTATTHLWSPMKAKT